MEASFKLAVVNLLLDRAPGKLNHTWCEPRFSYSYGFYAPASIWDFISLRNPSH